MNAPRIEFYRSHLAGNPCARCTGCTRTWAHWDDIDDLAHACPTTCTACEGEGETNPIWDDDTHTHTRRICPSCSGTGEVSQIVDLKECELCLGTGGNNYWDHLYSRYSWEYCPNCLNGIVIKLAKTVKE